MISKDTINKILEYARVEEVVGDFVHLKRAGANFKGVCPFHDEKTPSFVVSPAKNIYKCFGCGAAGDPLKFVMEHEHLSYPEGLKYLAAKYKIEIEETDTPLTEEQKSEQTAKESLLIAMKYAAKYYHDALLNTEEGKLVGLSYFHFRGFTDKTIHDFELGYAADSFENFTKSAQKAGYQLNILEKAGLVRTKDEQHSYDFFRARVMFPIHNLSGKVVAFGGRIMSKDVKQAKYINSPETEIYTKGKLVYGIFQAKNEIRKQDACYLVEGYTDVLSFYQAGIANVVASSGTALTKEQVKLIKRFSNNIILIYDGDQAGINAALRGVDIMLEEDMNVKVVVLPNGEDPDSFVKANGSEATLQFIEENKKDFIFFKSEILLKSAKNDPSLKASSIRNIVESIALIQDPIRKAYYTKECSMLAELSEDILIKEVNKFSIHLHKQRKHLSGLADIQIAKDLIDLSVKIEPEIIAEDSSKNILAIQEKEILRVLFQHGHRVMKDEELVIHYILNHIEGIPFSDALCLKIFNTCIEHYDKGVPFEQLQNEGFYQDDEIKTFIIDLNISPYQLSPKWESDYSIIVKSNERVWENDVISTINRFMYHKILERLKIIDQEIKELSADQTDENYALIEQKLFEKLTLQNSKKEIAKIPGTVIFK
ncbi:MAG: DNA primase [Chitinophagales bacterium]|nr:DNA primase [Chitinophagales bacterium]MCZ2394641.1 DNA primase [Chitinophagales bacterium]